MVDIPNDIASDNVSPHVVGAKCPVVHLAHLVDILDSNDLPKHGNYDHHQIMMNRSSPSNVDHFLNPVILHRVVEVVKAAALLDRCTNTLVHPQDVVHHPKVCALVNHHRSHIDPDVRCHFEVLPDRQVLQHVVYL